MKDQIKDDFIRAIGNVLPQTSHELANLMEKEVIGILEKSRILRIAQMESFEIGIGKILKAIENDIKASGKINKALELMEKGLNTPISKKTAEVRVSEALIKITKSINASKEAMNFLQQTKNAMDIINDILFMPGISLL